MIYARRPWGPDSEAVVVHGKHIVESVTAPGFTYMLEVDLAKEAVEVWSSWREGRIATLTEAISAVIWYTEHDAYQPVEAFDKIHADLVGHQARMWEGLIPPRSSTAQRY